MSRLKDRVTLKISIIVSLIIIMLLATWWFFGKPMTAHSAIERYVKQVRQRPGKPVEKLANFPVYLPVTYTGESDRSPFKPKVRAPAMIAGQGPDLSRPRGELEVFTIDSLRMVGVITQDGNTWAIVQAPNDTVYRISVGDFIGKNYGEVVEILPTEVQVSESISDGFGAWTKRPVTLTLSEK